MPEPPRTPSHTPPHLTGDGLKALEDFTLADLEAVRLILRGDSVIDWHRLNFKTPEQVRDFIVAQEFRPGTRPTRRA